MSRAVVVLAGLALAASCARAAPQPPQAPATELVALAADPESGEVGRLTVNTTAGQVELAERHASTRVATGRPPAPPLTLSDADIQQLFGPALAVQPPPAVRFLLYFQLGSDTLTPESKTQLPAVLAAVRGRVAADVSVVGHTDTIGASRRNAALGLERASLIREELLQTGMDPALIEVASHGESDLLVPTADNVEEPRNRRVEVVVR
jgi:outer membrane protein OmpA-like peptidoglycan-associated protein